MGSGLITPRVFLQPRPRESQVLQVLLDVPQGVCTLLELCDLIVLQLLVDDTGQSPGVEYAWKAQEDLILDAVHALQEQQTRSSRPQTAGQEP